MKSGALLLWCGTSILALSGAPVAAQATTATASQQPDQATTPDQQTSGNASDNADTGIAADPATAEAGEIIVTAQRRNESVQKTSLAVTALGGNELVQRGVRDLQDLQQVSPSLSFADAGLLKFANIRGIGLNLQSPTVVSGVATYRDGLFSPSPIFLNEGLFDIASVEVLRGPQGTFVGQNSTGGAIIQKTVTPGLGKTEGVVQLSGGNFDFAKAEAAVSLPLGETVAVRIAGMTEHRSSFYTNLGPGGDRPGRVLEQHGRITLLWEPSANFSGVLKSEVNFGNNGGYPAQPLPDTLYAPFDPPGPFTINYDRTDTRRKEFSSRNGLELNYTFDGGTVLRSITGYQYGYQNFLNDLDASASPEYYQAQKIRDNVYSQELNLISPNEGRFRWVLGGSYVRQTAQLTLDIFNARFPFDGTVFPTQVVSIRTLNPKTSIGGFAQGTFQLTDRLSIEAGGRVSHDRQTQEGDLTLSPTPPLPGRIDAGSPRYKDSRATGKLSVNFQATPDHLLFAFVANGFKAGGVNLPDGTFQPERVVDVEAGWKGTLFNGAVRTQVNGFWMDYRDLQLNIYNPLTTTTAVSNAGKSEIYGAEAQVQVRTGGFTASGNLSYVHSSLGRLTLIDTRALPNGTATGLGVQCPAGVPSNPPSCFDYTPFVVDLDGRQNLYSPKWTASADVSYRIALGGTATLTPQATVSYLSSQSTQVFERPVIDFLEARTLFGAQVTYADGPLSITLYGINLTDKRYRAGNDNANNLTYYGAPRQYGVRLTGRF